MPRIHSSADLRDPYNGISELCRTRGELVLITSGGRGDLSVMCVEIYKTMTARMELYTLWGEGMEEMRAGRVKPLKERDT